MSTTENYKFNRLADVESVDTASEISNVLIEEDGEIKKVPKTSIVKPKDLDIDIVVDFDESGNEITNYTINSIDTFDNIKNKILNGEEINAKFKISMKEAPDSVNINTCYCTLGAVEYVSADNTIVFVSNRYNCGVVLSENNIIESVGLNF